jgi:hypothetical protein
MKPGRGKTSWHPKGSWGSVVDALKRAGATREDFGWMLDEVQKNALRDGDPHSPEWRRENLQRAFREAGIEL